MKMKLWIVLFVVVCSGCAVGGKDCNDGWIYFEGSCYLLSVAPLSWPDSLAVCSVYGQIAIIESSEENDFLKNATAEKGGDAYWIGALILSEEDVWTWVGTWENVTITDWATGQPNFDKSNAYCAAISQSTGQRWANEQCSKQNYFICESEVMIYWKEHR